MQQNGRQWRKLTGENITTFLEEELSSVILREREKGHQLKVCIGTDSQVKGADTEFATAIVFIRKGHGGFMYLNNETTREKMSIRQRMITEVARSIEVAYALSDVFTSHKVDMEVHVDINTDPAYKSHDAFKEAVGYITGMGFSFRVKPDAFASSSCANRVVQ